MKGIDAFLCYKIGNLKKCIADSYCFDLAGPSKRQLTARVVEEKNGEFRVEFTPSDVGSHLVDVTIGGAKLVGGPLVAKAYNSSLIRVTDVTNGVVGQPCQFKGK